MLGRLPPTLAVVSNSARISNSVVDVTELRENLLLKLERERSDEVAGLRSKQKQVRLKHTPPHTASPS